MNSSDDDLRQEIALFRYTVIADLVHLPVGAQGIGDKLRDKASQSYTIPGSDRTHVAANTIRGWIKRYRYGGFDALYPKPRTDRGQPRRLPPEVAAQLIELKTSNPAWSVRRVIQKARDDGVDHPLAPSTVHRLLSREGLFDKKPPDGADRRRFAFKEAGELWMSDVMHGPKVRHGRTRRKTYLIAFIDDATRVIPFAAFALHESLSQRLVVRHHLTGLDREEVDAYLTHCLRLAGCELPLFEAPAVEALFQSARGLPRQINRIAHYALAAAALDKARTVNADHLQHALDELRP